MCAIMCVCAQEYCVIKDPSTYDMNCLCVSPIPFRSAPWLWEKARGVWGKERESWRG